ncbi:hypothetical protein MKY96_32700 [Paenibacillus sp. FSL R7-0302]|uniref:hypothetical protein n=1 Tax=Paenibacillus sp. FSL R7-0302 TaxID=2921681 RepID=UPI0030F88382
MTMTKKEIYETIVDWQMNAGEDFIDYWGSNITIPSFMFWCLGRGYLTKEQLNAWEADYLSKDLFQQLYASEPNYFIGGSGDSIYALCDHDTWEDGVEILSEFISESTTYQNRLKVFLREWAGEEAVDDGE